MKQIFAAILFFLAVPAFAADYSLPNPEVAVTLSAATSTPGSTVRVAISDPAYAGGVLTGAVAYTLIFRQGPYGQYFWGYNYTGTLTSADGHTAQYEQDWQRACSGGRGFHCWLIPSTGLVTVE
jgi:hypothetical protein